MFDGGGGRAGGSLFDWSEGIVRGSNSKRGSGSRSASRMGTPRSTRRRTYSPAPYYPTYNPSPYGSGGGGGLGRLGRQGRGGSPSAPSLSQWLRKDSDYQDQLNAFKKSLTDFLADVGRRKTTLKTDYETGTKRMGDQRVKDLQDIMNDFASRGLLKSGLYAQRGADYEKQYQQNLTDLNTQNKKSLTDISTEEKNYRRQQELQKATARKEAARRRAEKYGI